MNAPGTVVVTGASTGIGESTALRLDGMGFRVFAGVRSDEDAANLEKKSSDRLRPVMLDVTEPDSISSAVDTVREAVAGEGLQGLVNNAGVAVAGPLEFLPVEELRRQLEINVTGQVAVTQACLPLLREGGGRVVNVGSVSGRVASPFVGAYAASKFAMEALTDSLRRELAPWGLHVAVVQPGRVATPIWDKSLAKADELLAGFPQQAHALYGGAMERQKRAAAKAAKAGIPPEMVAEAVAQALTAEKPKTRYPVGREARLGTLLARVLPDSLMDRVAGF